MAKLQDFKKLHFAPRRIYHLVQYAKLYIDMEEKK